MRNLLILLLFSSCGVAQKLELFTRIPTTTTGKTIPVYKKYKFVYPNNAASNYIPSLPGDTYNPTVNYFPAYGTKPKYYISNTGLTTNTGTDSLHPWPLSKVQGGAVLPMGSVILFHRGQTFSGTVNVSANTSPSSTDSLIYDSYGVGTRPVLTTMGTFPNSDTASKWRQVAGLTNVWALKTATQFNYTPRIFFNGGTEYQRASDSTQINSTRRTSFSNADFQYIYVYAPSNPATYYTSIRTACISNNTLDISGQYLVAVRNLDIRGSQGACLDLSLNNGVLVEMCIIGRDGNRGGMRNNNVTNVVVKNNIFDSGERNKQNFNIATEGGDGCTFGQNGAHNIDVGNNYFLDWRHTGYLIEDDGTTATDSVVNVRYHNNYITAPDIDYGRAFAVYYFKGSNVKMDYNTYRNCPTQNQIAADGFISQYNRYDSISNVAYYNRPTGGALSIGHSSFIPRNMQFQYDTISNCLSFGIELTTPAAGTPGYGATNCTFNGIVFQNNGWDLYTPTTSPQDYPFNTDIIIRNRRDTNYLFIHNNTFTNNIFNRSSSEPPISYGQDSSTTTRFFLESVATFNSKNGTAGDVITGNSVNSSYSYPVVANGIYRPAEYNVELLSNTNAVVDSTGAWGLPGGGAAYAAIRNNASVTTPFELVATYNGLANRDAYVGFDSTWTLSNWFNWQFAIKVDSATGNYYYQNYAVTDTGKTIPAQIGDMYGLRKYSDGSVAAGYYRSGIWYVLKNFTNKLNSTSVYGKAAVGSNKTLLNAKTRRDRSNFGNTTYTLPIDANTSAGVFKSDGTLIRTLWGNLAQTAGTYTVYWNGKDDLGNTAPPDNYHAEVVSNNVKYNWDGVIGNTSTKNVGSQYDVIHSLSGIKDMVIIGTKMYYTSGWYETTPTTYIKSTTDINGGATPLKGTFSSAELSQYYCTTDGLNIYWFGFDTQTQNRSWIWASKVTDNSEVIFPNGTAVQATQPGLLYNSAIDYRVETVSTNIHRMTGLSVQKNGNYLFAARGYQNLLSVINKTTGAVAQTISNILDIRAIATDTTNGLWISYNDGSIVKKFTVNADGTLTDAGITLPGISHVTYLKITPDGLIAAIDAGANQQVKAFNNTTGALVKTLGQQGGYLTNADISNTKFGFGLWPKVDNLNNEKFADQNFPFIAFQPDGNMWVGDVLNDRYMRFSADWTTYIDQFAMQQGTITTTTHRNDSSRVFLGGGNCLEFAIDYTKKLDNGANGSWTLKRNWMASMNQYYDRTYSQSFIVSLPNGRTYAPYVNRQTGLTELWELVTGGTARNTGITWTQRTQILSDGTLIQALDQTAPAPYRWWKKALVGFDASNNPNWGIGTSLDITGGANVGTEFINIIKDNADPYDATNTDIYAVTASGKLITFGGGKDPMWHLGGIKLATGAAEATNFLWKTGKSTRANYLGAFPRDGWYDIGNGVQYGGGDCKVFNGNNIIWSYHGEFWKGSQTNYYTHVWENGLTVGFFGKYNYETALDIDTGMAGNVAKIGIAKYNNDTAFLYHGDEFTHSAVHRWSITGLSSIRVFNIALSTTPPVLKGIDLMAGLTPNYTTYDSVNKPIVAADYLPSGQFGWLQSPATNDGTRWDGQDVTWRAIKGTQSYDKNRPTDLSIKFSVAPDYSRYNVTNNPSDIPTQSKYITRDLTVDAEHGTTYNTSGVSTWTLSGVINWYNSTVNAGSNTSNGGGQFLEVLDSSGKVITRLWTDKPTNDTAKIMANNVPIMAGPVNTVTKLIFLDQPLNITFDATGATYKYGNYTPVHTTIVDPTANWQNPKTLRFYFWTWNDGSARSVGFAKGRFSVN